MSSENKILGLISNLCVNNLSIFLKTALQKILQIPRISATSNKKNHFSLSCKLEHIYLYTCKHPANRLLKENTKFYDIKPEVFTDIFHITVSSSENSQRLVCASFQAPSPESDLKRFMLE